MELITDGAAANGGAANAGSAAKAAILIESLPWLKKFRGQIIVVKFGGNAMVDADLQRSFAEDIVYLQHVGVHPVIVHGGGPQISARLAERQITSEFRGGLRVTTPEVMEVVRDVLVGEVNRDIARMINDHAPVQEQFTVDSGDHATAVEQATGVERVIAIDQANTVGQANAAGGFAASLSGESGRMLKARRRQAVIDGEPSDIGLVGDVVHVDPAPILTEVAAGRIPVISTIALDEDVAGGVLNVNADSAAAAIAIALKAAKLVVLTDVAGLYRDWPNRDSLVSSISAPELGELLPRLESGMIPKMGACLEAVQGGVPKAAIIDGRQPHSILLEIFTQKGIGTEVVPA